LSGAAFPEWNGMAGQILFRENNSPPEADA
jgi:hypothetical protein